MLYRGSPTGRPETALYFDRRACALLRRTGACRAWEDPMKTLSDEASIKKDVLQAPPHAPLSSEEVAKAVARHNREHPSAKSGARTAAKKPGKR